MVSNIAPLAIKRGGVNGEEVELKELIKADLIRGIGDVYGLGKASCVATYFFLGGIRRMAISIAYFSGYDSADLLEEVLCTPEATAG